MAGTKSWLVVAGQDFSPKTYGEWVKARAAEAIPGAVEFAKYADSKGVKLFYVTNRTADQEEDTRKNMEGLGFPMGGNVDTFLMNKEKEDWTSKKGTRRAYVAKDYRILLLVGDNYGDFSDDYSKSEAERAASLEANMAHVGHDWIFIANPEYGSFEVGAVPRRLQEAGRRAAQAQDRSVAGMAGAGRVTPAGASTAGDLGLIGLGDGWGFAALHEDVADERDHLLARLVAADGPHRDQPPAGA